MARIFSTDTIKYSVTKLRQSHPTDSLILHVPIKLGKVRICNNHNYLAIMILYQPNSAIGTSLCLFVGVTSNFARRNTERN